MSCLFCNIIAGNIPATILYNDDEVIALRDINPKAPTHLLIIPKQHITSINDVRPEHEPLIGHMIRVASTLAATEGLDAAGYRLVYNIGEHGGQTIYHIHLHLLGGRQLTWPPG